MYLLSMNADELLREFMRDAAQIEGRLPYFVNDLRREVLRQKTFPYYRVIRFRTKYGNNMFIRFKFDSKHFRDGHSGLASLYAVMKGEDGDYLVDCSSRMLGSKCLHQDEVRVAPIIIYKPHFFARYKERFGLLAGYKDAYTQFVARIRDVDITSDGIEGNHGEGYDTLGTFTDGLMYGTYSGDIITFRTYLAQDMLNNKQESLRQFSADCINECREDLRSLKAERKAVYINMK